MSEENAQGGAQTPEDKFFGKKTTIDEMIETAEELEKAGKSEDEITVEAVDEGEGGIVETPGEPAQKPKEAEPASKTGDDELDTYSEKVQKRINKLTWEREEANRKLTEAQAIQQEAVRYAQVVNQQNQQQANIIATGEARLVEQIKNRAALAVEAATQKYREAYTAGDTEKIIAAQKELTIAQAEQLESYNYEQDYQRRAQNWVAQQQQQQYYQQQAAQRPPVQQQPQQQQQRRPTPESQSWAQKNPWFGKDEHRDMTAIAYAEHERLIRDEGVQADTPEYYQKIDEKVRHHFPDYFAGQGGGNPGQAGKPPTVVAPGNRNNGSRPRTVRLEPHQVALAKQLGLTTEQYARQVLKESK